MKRRSWQWVAAGVGILALCVGGWWLWQSSQETPLSDEERARQRDWSVVREYVDEGASQEDSRNFAQALGRLASWYEPSLVPYLLQYSKHPYAMVRRSVTLAWSPYLEETGKEAWETIDLLLVDPFVFVRIAALEALSAKTGPERVTRLQAALNRTLEPDELAAAIQALLRVAADDKSWHAKARAQLKKNLVPTMAMDAPVREDLERLAEILK
jgi:hypothetical protein